MTSLTDHRLFFNSNVCSTTTEKLQRLLEMANGQFLRGVRVHSSNYILGAGNFADVEFEAVPVVGEL